MLAFTRWRAIARLAAVLAIKQLQQGAYLKRNPLSSPYIQNTPVPLQNKRLAFM